MPPSRTSPPLLTQLTLQTQQHSFQAPYKPQRNPNKLTTFVYLHIHTTNDTITIKAMLDLAASKSMIYEPTQMQFPPNSTIQITNAERTFITHTTILQTTHQACFSFDIPANPANQIVTASFAIILSQPNFIPKHNTLFSRYILSRVGARINFQDHSIRWLNFNFQMRPDHCSQYKLSPTIDIMDENNPQIAQPWIWHQIPSPTLTVWIHTGPTTPSCGAIVDSGASFSTIFDEILTPHRIDSNCISCRFYPCDWSTTVAKFQTGWYIKARISFPIFTQTCHKPPTFLFHVTKRPPGQPRFDVILGRDWMAAARANLNIGNSTLITYEQIIQL